jgi:hypothetical protein
LHPHARARTGACRRTRAHAAGSDLIVWGNEGHPKVKARTPAARRPPHGPICQASAKPECAVPRRRLPMHSLADASTALPVCIDRTDRAGQLASS